MNPVTDPDIAVDVVHLLNCYLPSYVSGLLFIIMFVKLFTIGRRDHARNESLCA